MAAGRRLALVMLGDCMLGRIVDESLMAAPAQRQRLWGDVLPLLRGGMAAPGEAQLNLANLETAVTEAEEPDDTRIFNFRMSPANVPALTAARLDFVSLANNHCLDFKQAGLADTQRTLRAAGIAFAGVGTAAAAAAPALLERGGLRVAVLCYADHFREWAALEGRPGINFIDPDDFDPAAVERQLAAARGAGADLTLCVMHWGSNWGWRPSRGIQHLARCLVDAGADVVFGTSSHHIQGIQVYRGRPIIYGAGAFVDDYKLDEGYRNDLGFLYCMHTDAAGAPAWLELVPTRILHTFLEPGSRPPYLSEVHLARGEDRRWLHARLRQLCEAWGTRVQDAADGRLRIPLHEAAQS